MDTIDSPQENEEKKESKETKGLEKIPKRLQEVLSKEETFEGKLEKTLVFMEHVVSDESSSHFRDFWDARGVCLNLFKESIHPTIRVHLWARYSELCREARKLKELFEEQSTFLYEQFEVAIAALEEEQKVPFNVEAIEGLESFSTQENLDQYTILQSELHHLNQMAHRTTSLRKDLIQAEIRPKQKNKLFTRLSTLGDVIFPRRKELIRKVSDLFLKDVSSFIQATFIKELRMTELFQIREEIKSLQRIAKILTLSTDAFQKTREQLGESWNSIKEVMKERKKAQHDLRMACKQHREELLQEIEELRKLFDAKSIPHEDLEKRLHHINSKMHAVSLQHQDVKLLREKMSDLYNLVTKKQEAMKEEKDHSIQKKFQEYFQNLKSFDPEKDEAEFNALVEAGKSLSLSKLEICDMEGLLAKARAKKEKRRREKMFLSKNVTGDALQKEYEALQERKGEIKAQIDAWRRASGSSSQNFSLAMRYTELIEEEKERLEEVEHSIHELEEIFSKEHEENSNEIEENSNEIEEN